MSEPTYPGFDTLSLHAGSTPDPTTGARATPIYLSTSFVFKDSDHAASLFNMERAGHVYSRISNPTNAVLEERIAALEGGRAAVATGSGMAAQMIALLNVCQAGDHIVAARTLYGGTHTQLGVNFKKLGIETTFVDSTDPENFARAITPQTKAVYAETMGNPSLNVLDIEPVAKLANQLIVAQTIDAVAQAIRLAELAGVDPKLLRDALLGGFAESRILQLHGDRMIRRDFQPGGRSELQLKDVRLICELAQSVGLKSETLDHCRHQWELLVDQLGLGQLDHSGLFKLYE
jgi:hypothetical protein